MGSTPDDSQLKLMDYLYGNLTQKEKEELEACLKKDPSLKQELEDFTEVKLRLGKVRDHNVPEPVLMGLPSAQSFWKEPFFRYAATITLFLGCLMLIGKFTGLNFQSGQSGFTVSFREAEMMNWDKEAESKALALELALVMEDNFRSQEMVLESKLEQKFMEQREDFQQQLKVHRSNTEEALLALVENFQKQGQDRNEAFRRELAHSQNEYFSFFLENMTLALQQMREEDLLYIQAWMAGLESDKAAFQQETEKILASLLYTVGNFQHE